LRVLGFERLAWGLPCTPDELETALAELTQQISDAEAELDSLWQFGMFLRRRSPAAQLRDLGFVDEPDRR
jgi:hypothetical protein